MSTLNIGVFADSYKPYTSGVVRSIETFRAELTALGHNVYIFAPKYQNCPPESGVYRFPSIPAPTNPDFTLAVPFSPRLRNVINKLNLDIIHVHSPFMLGRLGARYAKRLGIPLVFTFHTLYEEYVHYVPFAQSITKDLTQRICADFCNQCDLVVTPTMVIGEYVKKIGVKVPVVNIPTGIKIEEFKAGDENWLHKEYHINNDKKILLCVGRLGKEKNLEWLLEAVFLAEKEYPAIHLVIVGGGPEENNLKHKASALGILDKTTFTGVLPKEKVINCYRSADLFVFASVTETQGLVIGEAKAAGLPAVAVKAYGVSEMVEHGKDGFLTQLSREEFASRVLLLLQNDELRKQMTTAATANAEKISARNCTLKLYQCYLDLINKRNHKKTISN